MQLILPILNNQVPDEEPWFCMIELARPLAELMRQRLDAFNEAMKKDPQLSEHVYMGRVGESYIDDPHAEEGPIMYSMDNMCMVVDENGVFFRANVPECSWDLCSPPVPEVLIKHVLEEECPSPNTPSTS